MFDNYKVELGGIVGEFTLKLQQISGPGTTGQFIYNGVRIDANGAAQDVNITGTYSYVVIGGIPYYVFVWSDVQGLPDVGNATPDPEFVGPMPDLLLLQSAGAPWGNIWGVASFTGNS